MEADEVDNGVCALPGGRALHGSGIIAAIKRSGVEFILSVPDIVTSAGLLRPIAQDRRCGSSASARRTSASASPPDCPIATSAR